MKTSRMAMLVIAMAVVAATIAALEQAGPAARNMASPGSDKEKLVGAWHLASIMGPDGKAVTGDLPKGMLIYTRDGHISVQLMYPKTANARSNEYVQDGYEASFGGYDIDEATHTVTHHVQGSNTRDLLVGKDLPRIYRFSTNGQLIITSARADEHWSVTWEHY